MFLLLFTAVAAHMHMINPAAQFTNSRGDQNQPSGICSVIQYTPDSPSVVLSRFKSGLRGTLLDYVNSCGTRSCGNTNPNHIASSFQNTLTLSIGARHIGLVEIWLDNTRLLATDQLQDQYSVDLSQCSGTCRVRFIMAALHNFPAEIYDNCVMIRNSRVVGSAPVTVGSGPGAPANSVPPVVPPAPTAVPVTPTVPPSRPTARPTEVPPSRPTVIPPARPTARPDPRPTARPDPRPTARPPSNRPDPRPVPQPKPPTLNTAPEWSCSSDSKSILRRVATIVYTFPCAPGTTCQLVPNVSYPICNFAN